MSPAPADRFVPVVTGSRRPKAALHDRQSLANNNLLARQVLSQPTSYTG